MINNFHFDTDMQNLIKIISSRKIQEAQILNVQNLVSYTSFIIIITGKSLRQIISLAEHINIEMKKQNLKPIGIEGLQEGKWILIDYGNIIVHIFEPTTKKLYDIEGLWIDAPLINLSDYENYSELENSNKGL